MKGGVHYLQGESYETTHLLIHYKTKTAPTRLYLILMFRLASYTAIKKNPNKPRKKLPFFLLPQKNKESNIKKNTHHQNIEIPAIIQGEKKLYSCGNPKQRNNYTEYGSMLNLKNLFLEACGLINGKTSEISKQVTIN